VNREGALCIRADNTQVFTSKDLIAAAGLVIAGVVIRVLIARAKNLRRRQPPAFKSADQ